MNTITLTTLKTIACQLIVRIERLLGVPPQKASILFYHSISNDRTLIDVNIQDFEKQILYLKKHFIFIPLNTVLSYLKGDIIISKPSIALTFDDGYSDLLTNVVPVLTKYNIPATVFAIAQPELVNRPELDNDKKLLTLQQIKKMVDMGWSVGSHTLTHPNLLSLSQSELLSELKVSKKLLERKLHMPIKTVAYPKGFYNDKVLLQTKKVGYTAAFTTDWGTLSPNNTNFFQIPRIGVDHTYSMAQFPMLFTRSIIYYFKLKFLLNHYFKSVHSIATGLTAFLSQGVYGRRYRLGYTKLINVNITKFTITVGIPAHNEQKNIAYLLRSILKQRQKLFSIEKIVVISDGSSDSTVAVVRRIAKKHPEVQIIEDGHRLGKSQRLNQLYAMNKSDFILTFDADIALERSIEIELMVKEYLKHPDALVIGGRYVPVPQKSFMGELSILSYLSFEDAIFKLNNGNNFYTLMGCASLIKKKLTKSIHYPSGTVSDQNYLYASAIKIKPNSVRVARDSRILFRTVSTFRDWRILGVRSTMTDKSNVMRFFGKSIMKDYTMPTKLYAMSLIKWFFKSPIYTTGSVLMNIYIRKFPYNQSTPRRGVWELTLSSKIGIF